MNSLMRCKSGVPGLDEILRGGFIAERMYLIDGNPGAGKTTFAMQFLAQGVADGGDLPLRDPFRDGAGAPIRGGVSQLVTRGN
jgi:RecA/RadA recombinase